MTRPVPSIETAVSRRLFITSVLAIFMAATLATAFTLTEINSGIRPLLLAKVQTVTDRLADDIETALSKATTTPDLAIFDDIAMTVEARTPEAGNLKVLKGEAAVAAHKSAPVRTSPPPVGLPQELRRSFADSIAILRGETALPRAIGTDVQHQGRVVARVIATEGNAYFRDQIESFFFDTLVVLLAVILIATELVIVPRTRRIVEPLTLAREAVKRRASGDFAQYPNLGRRGLIPRFIAALNAMNAKLGERVTTALEASRSTGGRLSQRLEAFAAAHSLFKAVPDRRLSINDARIPLFVFCFAEELQKSFMPLFVAEYYRDSDWFTIDMMVGLPISAFMFVIAALTPFAGKLVDRHGNKRLFLLGLLPAIAGYILCFMARSGNDIVIARSLTAVGYAVITISCQSYIAAVIPRENRARGMAVFVGVLMAATMCGTAIGGILATWIGFKPVFLVAAFLAALSGVMGLSMLSGAVPADESATASTPARDGGFRALLSNRRFLMIVVFCAIPAKIVLTGFLYLFVPVYLANLNVSQSEIGRIMMVYSLVIIPISPFASRLSDRLGRNLAVVVFATIASGLVLTGLYTSPQTAGVLIVVACLGLAHAFIKAPLIVSAMEAAEASPGVSRTSALSTLRTSERVGSVIGPTLVGAMLIALDFEQTAAFLGAGIVLIGVVAAFVLLSTPKTQAEPPH